MASWKCQSFNELQSVGGSMIDSCINSSIIAALRNQLTNGASLTQTDSTHTLFVLAYNITTKDETFVRCCTQFYTLYASIF